MEPVSRRTLFKRAGAAAAVAGVATVASGAVGLLQATPAGAVTDLEGYIYDEGGQVFNVKMIYNGGSSGATGNTVMATGGSISSSSTSFSWSGGSFQSTDAGKVITVQGAGASGAVLSTTISTYVSATEVILATAASTTVSSATFSYGTDDTEAIVNTIIAAATCPTGNDVGGVVFVPPGIYTILDAASYQSASSFESLEFSDAGVNVPTQICLFGNLSMIGGGGKPIAGSIGNVGNTTFLCAASTSGLAINSYTTYQGFMVDGNNLATSPISQGIVGDLVPDVELGSAYMTFIDVWASQSAANGWTILASQNNSYYHCGSINNKQDGLYLDGGAGGLNFWNFQELNSGRYGLHTDDDVLGGLFESYSLYTGDIRFYGGSFVTTSSGPKGTNKVYVNDGQDYRFFGVNIVGANLSGPTVSVPQNLLDSYGVDFNGCTLSATPLGTNPGNACIQVSGSPAVDNTYTFLKTDGCNFTAGDNSVYIEAIESYQYWAIGWIYDGTTHGPYSGASGSDIDPLLQGRTGAWITPTLSSPWSGTVSYRMNADGLVELKGSATTTSAGGGTLFTLANGYNQGGSGNSLTLPAYFSHSTAIAPGVITVSDTGAVACDPGTASTTVYLDGIMFPPAG